MEEEVSTLIEITRTASDWAFYIAAALAMLFVALFLFVKVVDSVVAFFEWNKAIIEFIVHRKQFIAWKRRSRIKSMYPGVNE